MAFDQSGSYLGCAQLTYKCSECYVEFDELEEVRCHQKTCSQTLFYEALQKKEDFILPPAVKFELNNSQSNDIRDPESWKTNEKEPSTISYKHQKVAILYQKISDKLNSYLCSSNITTSSQLADSKDPYEFVDDEVEQNPKLPRRKVRKKPKRLTTKPFFAAYSKNPKFSIRKSGKTKLIKKLISTKDSGKLEDLKACLDQSYSKLIANEIVNVTEPESIIRKRKSRCKSETTLQDIKEESVGMTERKLTNDSINAGKCNSLEQKAEKQLMVKLPNINVVKLVNMKPSPGLVKDKKKLVVKVERLNHFMPNKSSLKRRK